MHPIVRPKQVKGTSKKFPSIQPAPPNTAPTSHRKFTKTTVITDQEAAEFRALAFQSERVQQKYTLMHWHKLPTHPNEDWLPNLVELKLKGGTADRHKREPFDEGQRQRKAPAPPDVVHSAPDLELVARAPAKHPKVFEREFSQRIWSMVTHSNQRVRTSMNPNHTVPENGNPPPPPPPTLRLATSPQRPTRSPSKLFTLTEVPKIDAGGLVVSSARSAPLIEQPWVGDATFNAVLHPRDGSHTVRVRRPHFSDADEAALRNLAGSPAMFRSMLWYRKQPIDIRHRRMHMRLEEERERWKSTRLSTAEKFVNFKKEIREDIKTLYTRAATEVERWESDRQRLYCKKGENLDYTLHRLWTKALNCLRRSIKEMVATEYLRDQVHSQQTFVEKFDTAVRRKYRKLSEPCERLLENVRNVFNTTSRQDKSLKEGRLVELFESIPHEALLLDDVISVLYSLSFVFRVEEDDFVALLRRRAGILALRHSHRSHVSSQSHTMSSWLMHIPVEFIGPETVLFILRDHNDFPSAESLHNFLGTLRPEVMDEVNKEIDVEAFVQNTGRGRAYPHQPQHRDNGMAHAHPSQPNPPPALIPLPATGGASPSAGAMQPYGGVKQAELEGFC